MASTRSLATTILARPDPKPGTSQASHIRLAFFCPADRPGKKKPMSTTAQRLIIDTERGTLIGTFSSVTGTTNPTFTLGDTCPIEIYLVKQFGSNSPYANIPFPSGSLVKCALGLINLQPTSGTWSIGYATDVAEDLAFDISAEDLEVALNALASITSAGGVSVAKVGSQFRISFETVGDKLSFYAGSNTLVPASDLQIQTLQQGGVSTNEVVMVNLAARPIALQTSFVDTPAISGYHSTNTYGYDGIARSGSYRIQLTYKQDTIKTVWTDAILTSSNTTQISQAIFQALVNTGWGNITGNATKNSWGVLVTQLEGNNWRVDITNPQFTTPVVQELPTIVALDTSETYPLEGKVADLGLNTVEAVAFLGTDESRRAVLEIEIDAGGEIQTILQAPCTLVGQVIYGGTFAPIPLETPISEAVANARFLRRDADQALDSSTKDQLWENLTGVTSPSGVDLVGALVGASAPSASNVYATVADLDTFDQSLNTTDSVQFAGTDAGVLTATSATVQGETKTVSFKIGDATNEYLAIDAAGVISTSSNANLGSVTITGSGMDTVYGFDSISYQGNIILTPLALNLPDGGGTASLSAFGGLAINDGIQAISVTSAGITFPDLTTQNTRTVRENQLNGSAFTVGGFDTVHYPNEVKVIDDQGNAWWVAARPA